MEIISQALLHIYLNHGLGGVTMATLQTKAKSNIFQWRK